MAAEVQSEGGVPPKPKNRRGCKIAAIIGAVVLLIILVAGIFICSNIEKIGKFAMNKGLNVFEEEVMANLPEDYNADKVENAFDSARRAIEEGELRSKEAGTEIQSLSNTVRDAMEDDKLTAEEVDEIVRRLEELAR